MSPGRVMCSPRHRSWQRGRLVAGWAGALAQENPTWFGGDPSLDLAPGSTSPSCVNSDSGVTSLSLAWMAGDRAHGQLLGPRLPVARVTITSSKVGCRPPPPTAEPHHVRPYKARARSSEPPSRGRQTWHRQPRPRRCKGLGGARPPWAWRGCLLAEAPWRSLTHPKTRSYTS